MSKKEKLMSVRVTVLNHIIDVSVTHEAEALSREYNLSERMIEVLARSYGGYLYVDMMSHPALARRGLYTEVSEGYKITELGQDLCEKMFVKRKYLKLPL